MKPFGRHDVGLEALEQGRKRRGAGADLVGQGGEAERHALAGVALGVTWKGAGAWLRRGAADLVWWAAVIGGMVASTCCGLITLLFN